MSPNRSAFVGFLFSLPFIITNFIVSLRIEPIYSFLGSFPVIRNSPFIPLILLLLFPIGAFIALYPMLQANKKRNFYIANSIVAIILLVVFFILFVALGEEIYRCDILRIPNCD
jgi:hypothetical protein